MNYSKREKVTIGKICGIILPIFVYLGIAVIIEIILMVVASVSGAMQGITDPAALSQYVNNMIMKEPLLLTLLAGLGAAPVLILMYRWDIKKDKINNQYIKYKNKHIGQYLLIIPFGIFNMLGANFFVAILEMIMPDFMLESYTDTANMIYQSSIMMQLLVGVIVGPIVEEMIFRVLIYNRIKKMTGVIGAAVLSSVLFGIYHENWVQAPYAVIIGLVCVFVLEKYKSVIAPILLHMSVNAFAITLTYFANSSTETTVQISKEEQVVSLIIFITISGILAAVNGLIIWYTVHPKKITVSTGNSDDVRKVYHRKEEKEDNKEENVDMKTTFYYHRRDNNSKDNN